MNHDGDRFGLAEIATAVLGAVLGGSRMFHGGVVPSGNGNKKGIIETLLDAYRESGGTAEDEAMKLEALFSDPTEKNVRLNKEEARKILALNKEMTRAEKIAFRLALYKLTPEVATVTVPAKKDGDKVVKPEVKKEERTGYNPRINVLKGIAAEIADDLSNVRDVAKMLREGDLLGRENVALRAYGVASEQMKAGICAYFGVSRAEDITRAVIAEKLAQYIERANALSRQMAEPPKPVKMGFVERLVNMLIIGPKDTPESLRKRK